MSKLIVIAGPQSSGKTSLLNNLKKKYSNWHFIDEINPATVTGKKDFGAVNTGTELEKKIIERDINNIRNISRDHQIVVLECGIFHYVYARHFIYREQANFYFKEYLKAHKGLDTHVIFIKTIPEVSLERRKEKYLKRIMDKGITDKKIIDEYLEQYRKVIDDLYPLWLECYKKVPFPKIMIENSYKEKSRYLKEADEIIQSLLPQKSP